MESHDPQDKFLNDCTWKGIQQTVDNPWGVASYISVFDLAWLLFVNREEGEQGIKRELKFYKQYEGFYKTYDNYL
jgi:hypothetical protein